MATQASQRWPIEEYDVSKTTAPEWLLSSQERFPEEAQSRQQQPEKRSLQSQKVFTEEDDKDNFKSPSALKAPLTMSIHPDFEDEVEPPRPLSPRSEAFFAPSNPRWAYKCKEPTEKPKRRCVNSFHIHIFLTNTTFSLTKISPFRRAKCTKEKKVVPSKSSRKKKK